MLSLTKGIGHETHMVLLVDVFDWNDYFDQMLSHTSNQEGLGYLKWSIKMPMA
jgi:hypothetical protein